MVDSIINHSKEISIPFDGDALKGFLDVPSHATGMVFFLHGSDSNRFSLRNRQVANVMRRAKLATLLFDLLTENEQADGQTTSEIYSNLPALAHRVHTAIAWAKQHATTADLSMGLFGGNIGAAAAFQAALETPDDIKAIVSRGGRCDLVMNELPKVKSPTLLIVGDLDKPLLLATKEAAEKLTIDHRLDIVSGATHLFAEAGKMEKVAILARSWFLDYL
jgi:pimeloyl-ACP methyl ester carboxylesterase